MITGPESRGAAPLAEKAAAPSSSKAEVITNTQECKRPFIPSWLDDAGLSQAEFRVYCHLCRCADNVTRIAWPSYKAMIKTCGGGKTTIRRCLEELVLRGLIVKAGKPFGGSCRYHVLSSIVPPQGLLNANSSTTEPIEVPPIVPPQDCNSPSHGTSIVPPQGQEGNPKKVIQGRKTKESDFSETLPFQSEEFRAAWNDWTQHRREKKKPLTETSMSHQFKALNEWGETRSIAAINHSVKNGYTGIFEPSPGRATNGKPQMTEAEAIKSLGRRGVGLNLDNA